VCGLDVLHRNLPSRAPAWPRTTSTLSPPPIGAFLSLIQRPLLSQIISIAQEISQSQNCYKYEFYCIRSKNYQLFHVKKHRNRKSFWHLICAFLGLKGGQHHEAG